MLLQVSKISKSFGVQPILKHVTFHIQTGERIGLVGINGAGKSTLLQIIVGELSADQGELFFAKDVSIGYFKQNGLSYTQEQVYLEMRSVFHELLRVEQEMRELELHISASSQEAPSAYLSGLMERYATQSEWFRAQGGYEFETKIRSILHGLGFSPSDYERAISTLSGGQKTRLALAKLLLQEPQLLVLDEPTNHLDLPTLFWLETYLRHYPGAILVVSHDRFFLDSLTTSIIEIENHTALRYTGNYTRFIETKAQQLRIQKKHYEKQQEEIEKMEEFIARNIARASTTKRAQSRRKTLDRLDRLPPPGADSRRAHFSFEIENPSAKDVLHVEQLNIAYDTEQPLTQQLDFHLYRGDSVALIGANGIGKSTFLKALIGQHQPQNGSIRWGVHTSIGYYDQEQANLNLANSILEEVWGNFPHIEELNIRKVLAGFLFSGQDVLKKIHALSGGERARVALAKLMLTQANVLILDEPTNHLDMYSKEILESALLEYEGTLLFISHDRYFMNKIAEKIIDMSTSGFTTYIGNYDDYVEKKNEQAELQRLRNQEEHPVSASSKRISPPRQMEKNTRRDERARNRKIELLEQEIANQEKEIQHLETCLADPKIYQDYMRVQEITSQLTMCKTTLQQSYEQWSQLLEE